MAYKINNTQVEKRLDLITGVVYDLGCGSRPFEVDILKYSDRYVGVDWSNTLHGLNADIVADLNKHLPIDNEVADSVVSFQVLEHLSEPQIMLNEAFRILKNNGKIFISVPFQWHVHEEPWDFFRYTKYGLIHLLTKSGFADIEVEVVTGFWVMWFLKLNYQLSKLIRGPRPLRLLVYAALVPFWIANQLIAPILDKFWNAEGETAWYFVTAHKAFCTPSVVDDGTEKG
ncbi:MAG: methyltransferase domain-containing protein [Gallionellaceae bacterium]